VANLNRQISPDEILHNILKHWDSLRSVNGVAHSQLWSKFLTGDIAEEIGKLDRAEWRVLEEKILLYEAELGAPILSLLGLSEQSDQETSTTQLPQGAEKLLYFILPKDLRESLPGDLEEEYRTIMLPKFGLRFARVWYWKQVVGSVLPIIQNRLIKLFKLAWVGKLASWLFSKTGT
jgi:hypothetical protein